MALGARPSGSRGEHAPGTEYEGRLGTLQESMRRVSYVKTAKMAGEDLLKPLDHTPTGEPPLASEAGKDDNENEDDEEESGKSKCTKGVIIGCMGEVQIVNTEMIREEEEAKANRKLLDLEIPNKSLLTLNAMLEATKARQAREIKYLDRKLRETPLLPPPPSLVPGNYPLHCLYTLHGPPHSSRIEICPPSDLDDSEYEEVRPDPAFDHNKSILETLLAEGI